MHASASRSTSLERRVAVGAERRVALHVPLHVARRDDLAGGERRAADHALDVRRERLLVAEPVLHRRDATAGERVRRRLDRRAGVHRLRRDDAEVARGKLVGVGRRREPAEHLAGAGEPQSVRVDRVDVLARRVVGPDLDVVELREIRGEERADRAAADDADSHE